MQAQILRPLTIEEVAPQCGWRVQTLRNRMVRGLPVPKYFKLPHTKRLLWRQEDINSFLTTAVFGQ